MSFWEFLLATIPLAIFLTTTYLLSWLLRSLKSLRGMIGSHWAKVVLIADTAYCLLGAVTSYIFVYVCLLAYQFVPRPYIQPLNTNLLWFEESFVSKLMVMVTIIFACIILIDEALRISPQIYQKYKFGMRNLLHFWGIIGAILLYLLTFENLAYSVGGFLVAWGDLQPDPNWP